MLSIFGEDFLRVSIPAAGGFIQIGRVYSPAAEEILSGPILDGLPVVRGQFVHPVPFRVYQYIRQVKLYCKVHIFLDDAEIVGVTVETSENCKILVVTSKGFGKMSLATEYRLTKRGTKGVLTLNATDKNGKIVAMRGVYGDEDLMIITGQGIVIRIPLEQIKISGRNTQGVRVIKLEERQKVASIAIVPHEEESDEVEETEVEQMDDEVVEEIETKEDDSFENDTALMGSEE